MLAALEHVTDLVLVLFGSKIVGTRVLGLAVVSVGTGSLTTIGLALVLCSPRNLFGPSALSVIGLSSGLTPVDLALVFSGSKDLFEPSALSTAGRALVTSAVVGHALAMFGSSMLFTIGPAERKKNLASVLLLPCSLTLWPHCTFFCRHCAGTLWHHPVHLTWL